YSVVFVQAPMFLICSYHILSVDHMTSLLLFLLIRPPPSSTLFPYTTLFRFKTDLQLGLRRGAWYRVIREADGQVILDVDHQPATDRKSTRLNSSHLGISYAVFCLKKKKNK